jgi:recombination protein RecA
MNKKLKDLKAKLDKAFNTGDLMLLETENPKDIEVIPSGIYSLDSKLGVGGIPRGRVIEFYGVPSGGKSSLALYFAAEAQKQGLLVAYLDTEHSLDLALAQTLGVNIHELVFSQPDSGEQALELMEELARSGDIGLIILDSVAALVPKVEIEGEMGESHMGIVARLMSQALRKLTPVLSKTNTTAIFLNQIRQKIGVFYGPNEETTGGMALKFYSSIRLEIRKGEAIKEKDIPIGHSVIVKVTKNKVAPPFLRTEFPLIYGKGVDKVADILDLAISMNIVVQSGAKHEYKGEKIAHGRNAVLNKLADTPDLLKQLIGDIDEIRKSKKTMQALSKTNSDEDKE